MKKFILLFYFLMLAACNVATTQLSGIVDPSYRDNFQSQKMVVIGAGMPLDEQKALEHTLEESLAKYDVQVLRGLEVFPPTRDYSDRDIFKIASNIGVDTILIVSTGGHKVSETYIPPTYSPGTSTSHVSVNGNFATVQTYTTPGTTSGGYSIRKPGMNVKAQLKNTKNSETIWTAEGFSGGNAYASFSDLTVSVARTTVEELSKVKLIKAKEIPQKDTKLSQE